MCCDQLSNSSIIIPQNLTEGIRSMGVPDIIRGFGNSTLRSREKSYILFSSNLKPHH